MASSAEGFVKFVHEDPSIPPVIAITEVGRLKSSTFLDCAMAIENTSNRPILKIFNHNGGTVEEEDTSRRENGKKYLVLRNKKTNKVTIYGTKVTYFKKPDYFKMKTFEDDSLINKNHEFNLVFGTKKLTNISKSKNNDTVVTLKNVFENISSDSDLLNSSFSQIGEFSLYLPTGCNRFSNRIDSVYPVSTLLFDNEIDEMTEFSQEILTMLPISIDGIEEFGLSKFFIENINRLTYKTIQNICLLAYADGLIELLGKRSSDFSYRNCVVYPHSEIINNKLLDNFLEYSVVGRDFTSKMKDKVVCHIIIIMILINMNNLDLSWISPFLPSSSQKRLMLLLKVVGVTPLKEDRTKYTLKIPLASLPSIKKQPKRSR